MIKNSAALSIEDVREILEDKTYQVRPCNEPVPTALEGLFLEELFANLVRMMDGEAQQILKRYIVGALASVSQEELTLTIRRIINEARLRIDSPELLTEAIYTLPILVIADQVGMDVSEDRHHFVTAVKAFAQAIVHPNDQAIVKKGEEAAQWLYQKILPANGYLKRRLMEIAAHDSSIDESIINLNLLGLFFQTLDGTSGLIGQMLQYSQNRPDDSPQLWMERVLQQSPPIQNTRRFKECSMLLLPLQGAEQSLPFGSGAHECPGKLWAKTMALEVVAYLYSLPIEMKWLQQSYYKKSPNARVPEFYSLCED